MNLRTRAAWAGITHLPEVVVLVAEQNMVFRQMLEPGSLRFRIKAGAIFGAALEHCRIKQVFVYPVNFSKKFPRPVYRLGLEIISKTPVAEHLKHGMMVCIMPNLFKVIMLSADSQTLLRIRGPFVGGR